MRRRYLKKKGFTLVEVLIVSSLIAMITLSLYSSFANGIKLWNRSQQFVIERDIAIFFDKISREMRNSFHFSLIRFEGRSQKVRFPTVVRTLEDPKLNPKQDRYVDQIGSIEYLYDENKNALIKRTANYGLAVEKKYLTEEIILADIKSVDFIYYYIDGDRIHERDRTNLLPRLVLIAVSYEDDKGRERVLRKEVYLPMGDNIKHEAETKRI